MEVSPVAQAPGLVDPLLSLGVEVVGLVLKGRQHDRDVVLALQGREVGSARLRRVLVSLSVSVIVIVMMSVMMFVTMLAYMTVTGRVHGSREGRRMHKARMGGVRRAGERRRVCLSVVIPTVGGVLHSDAADGSSVGGNVVVGSHGLSSPRQLLPILLQRPSTGCCASLDGEEGRHVGPCGAKGRTPAANGHFWDWRQKTPAGLSQIGTMTGPQPLGGHPTGAKYRRTVIVRAAASPLLVINYAAHRLVTDLPLCLKNGKSEAVERKIFGSLEIPVFLAKTARFKRKRARASNPVHGMRTDVGERPKSRVNGSAWRVGSVHPSRVRVDWVDSSEQRGGY
jgi:hypothetical protein